jgi:glycosyltransferase involved in cell wall biosynthesis
MYGYAYVKNGDVVRQLERIGQDGALSTSGPDGFLNGFLQAQGADGIYLVGTAATHRRHRNGRIRAESYPEGSGRWRTPLRLAAAFRLLTGLLLRRPERIVCGKLGPMLWSCFVASRVLRVPLVFSCHNSLSTGRATPLQRWRGRVDAACIRRSAGAVCHGPFLRQELEAIGVDHGRVAEFDVDFSDVLRLRQVNRPPYGKRTILFVGRIERAKGVFDLLSAATPLMVRDRSWRLAFVGSGRHEAALTDAVADSGLGDRVRLTGELPHADVVQVIQDAAVMVTPTRPEFPEGRCMAAMEALVLGVPVLAPDFGPFRHLVRHGENGVLFRPGDVEDLTASLEWMLEDRTAAGLRSGARASGEALTASLGFSAALRHAFEEIG